MTIIHGDFSSGRKKEERERKNEPVPQYTLHISLAFSDPLIWRRVKVPGSMTLKQLDQVLQLCMGLSGEYSHQFYVGKVFYSSHMSPGKSNDYYEGNYDLQTLEEAMKWCFTYMYDAGDGWEYEIAVEEIGIVTPGDEAPVLIDGEWAVPPEDIGSVHVYEKVLWALENPGEQGSRDLIAYHEVEGFDPCRFDRDRINTELRRISWAA